MENIERQNAKIKSVILGYEDHGILTCMVHLEYDGGGQGFGGYCLDEWDEKEKQRIGTAYGLGWIIKLLKTLEVDTIKKLEGLPVRVEASSSKVHRIGHYLKDQWFDPEVLRQFYQDKEQHNYKSITVNNPGGGGTKL